MSSTSPFIESYAAIAQQYRQCLALCTPSRLSLPSCSTSSSKSRLLCSIRSRKQVGLVKANRTFGNTKNDLPLIDDEGAHEFRSLTAGASSSVDFDDSAANDWMSWTSQDEPIVSNAPSNVHPNRLPRHNQEVHGKHQLDSEDSQENRGFPEQANSSKGSLFTSRLGEILATFKKKNDGPGHSMLDSPSSSIEKKSFYGERSIAEKNDPTSSNLFASDPPIPWEADKWPSTKPQPALKRKTSRSSSSPKPFKSSRNGKPQNESKLKSQLDAVGSNTRKSHVNFRIKKDHEIQALRINHKKEAVGPEELEKPVDPMDNVNFEWGSSDSEDDMYTNFDRSTSSQSHTNTVQIVGPSNAASWKHNLSDLPFEFQYSYTETPKAPVVRFREQPYSPFGASTMERPWTGRAPLKPSKKKLPEFDSFNPPPKGKKGIKYVQDPGPFSEGQGPKPSKTREEILGEPLTKEEIVELIEKCKRESRQVNLGRDGLTHNMLEIIHCHWKRRRVCKIKCKGVPTVDMDNVCFHLEDKTGGKIIYRVGGLVYLFRGRNYNYKDRPKIPLMLWKPATPVYPKLIQDAPEGLTKEEADRLRILGRKVEPIRRLGKNGVYLTLVQDVRDAFKVDDLVRIDCRGLNPSDYKKIGAKLRDLVPCVLLSFDKDHILMWRGKGLVSSDDAVNSSERDTNYSLEIHTQESTPGSEISAMLETPSRDDIARDSSVQNHGDNDVAAINLDEISQISQMEESDGGSYEEDSDPDMYDVAAINLDEISQISQMEESDGGSYDEDSDPDMFFDDTDDSDGSAVSEDESSNMVMHLDDLWSHALVSGMAVEVDECDMNCETILKKVKELAQTAPIGPVYTWRLLKKFRIKEKCKEQVDDIESMLRKKRNAKKPRKIRRRSTQLPTFEVPPMGGMGVDELARLLAPR